MWKYKGDPVELNQWVWLVVYKDGTQLKQFDDNGVFHNFTKEVDQSQVAVLVVYNYKEPDKQVSVEVPEGAELFFGHRTSGTFPSTNKKRVCFFGYQNHCFYIKENGAVHFSQDSNLNNNNL